MPDQQQIFAGAIEAAPKDYTVGDNVELTLISVHAEFRDSGAAGDWLPAVQLISDSGHVIDTAAEQGVKVSAGGDADGSFFPGGVVAAASSGTSTSSNAGFQDFTAHTVGAGSPSTFTTLDLRNGEFVSNDPAITFSVFDQFFVRVGTTGQYRWWVGLIPDVDWPTDPTGPIAFGGLPATGNTPFGLFPYARHPEVDLFTPPGGGADLVWATGLLDYTAAGRFYVGVENKSGSSFTIDTVFFFLYRVGGALVF